MAGHSKWANIKFRKSAQDAKRGKIFTKLIRQITVSARMGGADEASNSALREAVGKALKANMKRDTIDNAIKRGAGGLDGANMLSMRYEGYGPSGVAILVDCLSDNKNRTVSDVRHAFTKFGGNLGTDGSVAFLFQQKGEILLASGQSEEAIMEVAIEAGALDVVSDEGQVMVLTDPVSFDVIREALEHAKLVIEFSEVSMLATTMVPVEGESAVTLRKLIDMLEDLDDVQAVYTNADFLDTMLDSVEKS